MSNRLGLYNDGIGYVELVEVMGDEQDPAGDARMSTGKGKIDIEKDMKLSKRLISDRHTSPFEGVVLKFEMCVPLFVLREIDRHRTLTKVGDEEVTVPDEAGRKWFSRNEMSGRYVQMPPLYYFPEDVRRQAKLNVQGGDGLVDREVQETFLRRGNEIVKFARETYDWAVAAGVEKGLARIFNTQNQYTKIRMTGSLKNWFDFLHLRMPKGVVLYECREVAIAIADLIHSRFPHLYDIWADEVATAVTLNASEIGALRSYIQANGTDADVNASLGDEFKSLLAKLRIT